jgi:hypothetical protein
MIDRKMSKTFDGEQRFRVATLAFEAALLYWSDGSGFLRLNHSDFWKWGCWRLLVHLQQIIIDFASPLEVVFAGHVFPAATHHLFE